MLIYDDLFLFLWLDGLNLVWPPKPRVVGSIPASRATLMFFAIILFKTAFDDSVFRG